MFGLSGSQPAVFFFHTKSASAISQTDRVINICMGKMAQFANQQELSRYTCLKTSAQDRSI